MFQVSSLATWLGRLHAFKKFFALTVYSAVGFYAWMFNVVPF